MCNMYCVVMSDDCGVVNVKEYIMKNYSTENIINLALTGHATTGKTVLAEAMISNAGMIHKMGSIKEGTTISDYREYEIKNQHSISLTLMNLE